MIALAIASVLVPVAALALGTVSGSRKLFEVSYLIVWYLGSIEHLAPLDIMGTTDAATTSVRLSMLLMLSVMGGIIAWAARARQLQS
jgi:hypothetical protein